MPRRCLLRRHDDCAGRAGYQSRARCLGALLLFSRGPPCLDRADEELRSHCDHCGVFRIVGHPMNWLNVLVQGGLLGGFYALFAIGLSMSFGIMRLVNIAHGDLIVLSAYVALVVTQGTGLDPISSLLIVIPVMFALGYVLQRGLLNLTLSGGLLPPLLVTFGISVIIENLLLEAFGAHGYKLQAGTIEID